MAFDTLEEERWISTHGARTWAASSSKQRLARPRKKNGREQSRRGDSPEDGPPLAERAETEERPREDKEVVDTFSSKQPTKAFMAEERFTQLALRPAHNGWVDFINLVALAEPACHEESHDPFA